MTKCIIKCKLTTQCCVCALSCPEGTQGANVIPGSKVGSKMVCTLSTTINLVVRAGGDIYYLCISSFSVLFHSHPRTTSLPVPELGSFPLNTECAHHYIKTSLLGVSTTKPSAAVFHTASSPDWSTSRTGTWRAYPSQSCTCNWSLVLYGKKSARNPAQIPNLLKGDKKDSRKSYNHQHTITLNNHCTCNYILYI